MNQDLHKLVYCSRNLITGNPTEIAAEVQQILASSRANNMREGVSGALLYNAGMFAQVLEGPTAAVGRIFEAIQRDPRHSEVVVIESAPAMQRDFPDWSMAFSGVFRSAGDEQELLAVTEAFDAGFAHREGAAEKVLDVLKNLVVQEDDWVLLDAA